MDKKRSDTFYLSLLLIWAAVLQLPALFCGFELCDSGFYMTFYSNFFDAPESVEYNFMYWLSGLFGGIFHKLTGGSLLAMRGAGLLFNLLIILMVARIFREKADRLPLAAAVTAVCAGLWSAPLTFYYDILTSTLATLSILLIYLSINTIEKGEKPHQSHQPHQPHQPHQSPALLILAAGAAAGFNIFSRIPNVLEFGFIFLIPIGCRLLKRRGAGRLSLLFAAGWVGAIVVTILIMALLGHLEIFLDNMRDLFGIASSEAGEASHGAGALIRAQIDAYFKIFKVALPLAALLGITWLSNGLRRLRPALYAIAGICAGYIIYTHDAVTSLAAVTYTGLVAGAIFARDSRSRFISLCAIFLIVILPLGSDGGIYNGGTELMWLPAAAAFAALCGERVRVGRLRTGISAWATAAIAALILIPSAVRMARGGVYFDDTPLSAMTSEIRGVRTSPERTARVDRIVATVKEHTQPGETLMVYGSAPMINELTGTRPFIGCSWGEQLSAARLAEKLEESGAKPKVLLIRFNTIGARWGAPSEEYVHGRGEGVNIYHNAEKSEVVFRWLQKKGYRKIAESADFTLYE